MVGCCLLEQPVCINEVGMPLTYIKYLVKTLETQINQNHAKPMVNKFRYLVQNSSSIFRASMCMFSA